MSKESRVIRRVRRIATAAQASKTGEQGERSFDCCQARSGDPYCRRARDPALRHRRLPRRLRAWPRGSPRPDGDARHSVHAPCDTARPLRHDRSLRRRSQPAGNDGAAARHGIAGRPTRERDADARPYPCPQCHAGPDHRAVPARLNGRPGRALKTGCVNNHWLTRWPRWWSESGPPPGSRPGGTAHPTRSGAAGSWAWWAGRRGANQPW